ncbi:MAG: hypothetical protein ACMXX7_02415 [Candidatus Woesearchaeota archaeon]
MAKEKKEKSITLIHPKVKEFHIPKSPGALLVGADNKYAYTDSRFTLEYCAKMYVDSRFIAETHACENNHYVADIPMLIKALDGIPDFRENSFNNTIHTTSMQLLWPVDKGISYLPGFDPDKKAYELLHPGVSNNFSLTTPEGLKERIYSNNIFLNEEEWVGLQQGKYKGESIERISLSDVKKGVVPQAGVPHVIHLSVPEDYSFIPLDANILDVYQARERGELIIFEKGWLNKDQFRLDDTVLAIMGGPQNVELFADWFLEPEKIEIRSKQDIYRKTLSPCTPPNLLNVVNRGSMYITKGGFPNPLKHHTAYPGYWLVVDPKILDQETSKSETYGVGLTK